MTSFAAALLFASFFISSPAFARGHCWCEIATACPKDGGRTAHNFGSIHSYGRFESGKQVDCATRCGDAANAIRADLRNNPDALCARLGPGTYDLNAYSKVGHRDTRNNWCNPDASIGRLKCEVSVVCPPGYDYDAGAGLCKGFCGGVRVLTRPEDEVVIGSWLDIFICQDDPPGELTYGEWPVQLLDEEGVMVTLDDAWGDLDYDDLPAELDTLDEFLGGACGENTCGQH